MRHETIDGPCQLSEAVNILVNIWNSLDEIAEVQEAPLIFRSGLAIVSTLTSEYGQEYFTFEEIDLIENVYYALTDMQEI